KSLRGELAPDVVVAHSGLASSIFLRELFPRAGMLGYYEYFYRARGSDLDFRPDFAPSEAEVLRTRTRNAMILLDLEYCDAGYCATGFQRGLFPQAYRPKLRV